MSPNAIHTFDTEEEFRALVPNPVLEFEDDPSEDTSSEEDPSEEEPEEAPIDEEMEEDPEDPEEAPDSPIAIPNTPLVSPMSPHVDPYEPPRGSPMTHTISPTTSTDPRLPEAGRWSWIPSQLRFWRRQEGARIPQDIGSSTAPISPVTGEPIHHTIPLLVAHSLRQDYRIERLEFGLDSVPNPEYINRIHREYSTLRADLFDLRDHHERWEGRVVGDTDRLDAMERQMERFGEQLTDIRTMMEEMRESISHLTRGLPRPRREN